MGFTDRVRQEQAAVGVTRWPRLYMSMATSAYDAGRIDEDRLEMLLEDVDLLAQVVDHIDTPEDELTWPEFSNKNLGSIT